ncbi:hypothetical protein [Afipia sp. P52-10]|uniref:hypothetical protein n=1 Tax=Afipia sp. P52-10 TaxID=1429916 RepID=UPI0012691AE4|nr:hypothetical protein [Afipia sp. P52-10]
MTLTSGRNGENPDGIIYLAMEAFAAAGKRVPFGRVGSLQGTVSVKQNLIPTLVTFDNLEQPKSVRVVRVEDMSLVFGAGYRLKDVLLTIIPVGFWPFDIGGPFGEPVTRGIEQKLRWIDEWRAKGLADQISGASDRFTVNVPYFTRR